MYTLSTGILGQTGFLHRYTVLAVENVGGGGGAGGVNIIFGGKVRKD